MPLMPEDPKKLGLYFTLAQVGMEMVCPLGLGLVLDFTLGWAPWGAVVGAILGLVAGVAHLVLLSNRNNKPGPPGPRRELP